MEDLIIKLARPIKRHLRLLLPRWALRLLSKWLTQRRRKRDANRPVKDVFTDIYKRNDWGGISGEYFSGTGSIDPSISAYEETIKRFISTRQITEVVDLGCGDFRVGSQIQLPGVKYIGIDIVSDLVERNKKMFGDDNIAFYCLDIISDNLPGTELCLIRQVLQHLSNEEIAKILKNTRKYKYVIVTEHLPPSNLHIIPNKDKPHGLDIRLDIDSGVYLDKPPFNVKISEVLLDVEISTYLYCKRERLTSLLICRE
jgi:SAM-dependent methyltransferase